MNMYEYWHKNADSYVYALEHDEVLTEETIRSAKNFISNAFKHDRDHCAEKVLKALQKRLEKEKAR